MTNPNKRKGTAWESSVRDHLNGELGLLGEDGKIRDPFFWGNARRPAQEGARDVGDVHLVPFVLECKDVAKPTIPGFLRQAVTEAGHAGFPFGVAVVKVRGAAVRRGKVYFTVATWTQVRHVLGMDTDSMRKLYGFTATVRGTNTERWYLSCEMDAFAALVEDVRAVYGTEVIRAVR
ncbi:hypothetical protein OU787_17410 [Kitasatospora sp. YST-16]|uniref:hypothetical protein n=1 Tax=Kitasatospora sp. YST-16 TaxID=2998080 RepID=UPI002284A8D1|nr:hypothetical protein [Kitasatospora sp. YST-16]WAL73128.1 hypothetical protein OU787_17410 [Kitasatospora sp. YST-16]WNW39182.1 hypothetical protein RKE32_17375 [Streptomyces sp. Li-HN-5-13]